MVARRFDRCKFYVTSALMVLAWSAVARAESPSAYPSDPAEQAQLEEDWRKQDGIATPREAVTYQQAVAVLWERIERLTAYLEDRGSLPEELRARIRALRPESDRLADGATEESAWRELWLAVHRLRRDLMFSAAEAARSSSSNRSPAFSAIN